MTSILTLLRRALPALLLAATCATQAQNFPVRPVHVVFPLPSGFAAGRHRTHGH